MTLLKVTWEEIISSFDEIEKQLSNNIDVTLIESLFVKIRENIKLGNFEKAQIKEARIRTDKILTKIKEIKQRLQDQSVEILAHKVKLNSYSKIAQTTKNN